MRTLTKDVKIRAPKDRKAVVESYVLIFHGGALANGVAHTRHGIWLHAVAALDAFGFGLLDPGALVVRAQDNIGVHLVEAQTTKCGLILLDKRQKHTVRAQ